MAALVVLVIALRGVDLTLALDILLDANPLALVAVVLVQVVAIALRLVRWKYQLLPAQDVSLRTLVSPLLISFAVGNVGVTGIGLVPRVYLLGARTRIDNAFIAGTWLQEYILDATVVVAWAALVPSLVELPPQFGQIQFALILPLAFFLLIDLAIVRRQSLLVKLLTKLGLWESVLRRLPSFIGDNLRGFGDGLGAAFAFPLSSLVVVLSTLLIWLLEVVIFWLLLSSIGIPFSHLQASAVVAFTHLVIGVPAFPGFAVTLEAVTVTLVLALGGSPSAALAYLVLLRIFLVGPTTLVGAILAWREGIHFGDQSGSRRR